MANAFIFDNPTSAPRKINQTNLTPLVDLKIDGELVTIFADTSIGPDLFASYLVNYPVVVKTNKTADECVALRGAAPKALEVELLIDDSVSEQSVPPDDDTSEQSVNELSSASSESKDSLSEATTVEDDISELDSD
jgi:hypothetical protein